MNKWVTRAQGTWRHIEGMKSLECTAESDAGDSDYILRIELSSLKEAIPCDGCELCLKFSCESCTLHMLRITTAKNFTVPLFCQAQSLWFT